MSEPTKSAPTLAALRARRDEILVLAEHYGASNLRVFGSVARGDSKSNSDIDLLVDFREGTSLFELSSFWQDLQELLGYEVNILSEGGLKASFRKQIEGDLVTL